MRFDPLSSGVNEQAWPLAFGSHGPDRTIWPSTISRALTFRQAGLTLGADTTLVRLDRAASLSDADRARLLVLLAIATHRPFGKDVLVPIEAAIRHWHGGDKALAQLRLTFAGLPRLSHPEDADRLKAAAWLLDQGMSPLTLMKELELGRDGFAGDGLEKYDPNQPRVPAGNGRESGRWTALWDAVRGWLEEKIPVHDQDTGIQYGTQPRWQALATNPAAVGVAGTALLGGVEAEGIFAAEVPEAASVVSSELETGTEPTKRELVEQAKKLLPDGMSVNTFGKLAGFVQGQPASRIASREATQEILSNLSEAGVTKECISLFRQIYSREAVRVNWNESAIHRAKLLENIERNMK